MCKLGAEVKRQSCFSPRAERGDESGTSRRDQGRRGALRQLRQPSALAAAPPQSIIQYPSARQRSGPAPRRSGPTPLWPNAALAQRRSGPTPLWPKVPGEGKS
uniref:Uncharacterized protein n=1 Tax=Knipowitschia caucasica TaxID=637954 RepID=A0AAV2J317_KNICA